MNKRKLLPWAFAAGLSVATILFAGAAGTEEAGVNDELMRIEAK